jgi:hypothetical protein
MHTNRLSVELSAEGLSISVISKNDLLFLKGYGLADKDTNTHVTPSTLFGIGTVSKIFTDIAIMQLVKGRGSVTKPKQNIRDLVDYFIHEYLAYRPCLSRWRDIPVCDCTLWLLCNRHKQVGPYQTIDCSSYFSQATPFSMLRGPFSTKKWAF